VKEEDVLKQYPMDFATLLQRLQSRYTDFKANEKFNKIKRYLEQQGKKYCIERYLDPIRKSGAPKRFYSPEVFKEFDKRYTKKADSIRKAG